MFTLHIFFALVLTPLAVLSHIDGPAQNAQLLVTDVDGQMGENAMKITTHRGRALYSYEQVVRLVPGLRRLLPAGFVFRFARRH
jgi:hypothetical protein